MEEAMVQPHKGHKKKMQLQSKGGDSQLRIGKKKKKKHTTMS